MPANMPANLPVRTPESHSSSSATLFDRLAKRIVPAAIESFTPPPRQIADELWLVERRLRMPLGVRLSTHMTLLRLPGGGIVVHAPLRLDPSLLAATQQLGPVVAIIAPNSFHYCYAGEWVQQFPAAAFFYAPGLALRVPSLPAGVELRDHAPEVWGAELDQVIFGPIGPISEVVFRHRRSRTLILCDLAFNLTHFDSAAQRIAWRLLGVPLAFGPSRTVRLTLLRDRDAARPYLRRIGEQDFDRIIVAHGDVIETGGRAVFERGFAEYL